MPCEEENPDIGMASEEINIVLERTYYQVAVDFVFFNPSESVSLDIGFPFFEAGIQGDGEIFDFKCWSAGKEIDFSDNLLKMC